MVNKAHNLAELKEQPGVTAMGLILLQLADTPSYDSALWYGSIIAKHQLIRVEALLQDLAKKVPMLSFDNLRAAEPSDYGPQIEWQCDPTGELQLQLFRTSNVQSF